MEQIMLLRLSARPPRDENGSTCPKFFFIILVLTQYFIFPFSIITKNEKCTTHTLVFSDKIIERIVLVRL